MSTKTKKYIYYAIGGIVIVIFLGALTSKSPGFDAYEKGIGGSYSTSSDEYAYAPEMLVEANYDDSRENTEEQYIIKTGNLNIVVDDIDKTVDQVISIAKLYGGNVTDRYIYSYNDEKSGSIELRVDESNFETTMNEIKELAKIVESENVSADDVTEQVIDIQARLNNAQAEELSYLSVLDRANTVEDILEVHRYLSDVRENIERYEAQLEYYENYTSYSTITIYLSEATSIILDSDTFQPWQTIKDSVQSVVRIFQNLVLAIIELVIVGGSIIIPVIILFFIGRRIYRKYKK